MVENSFAVPPLGATIVAMVEAFRPWLGSGHRCRALGWSGPGQAPMGDPGTAEAFPSSCIERLRAGRSVASSGRRR